MIPQSKNKKWSPEFLEKQLAAIEAKLNECFEERRKQQRNLLVTETVPVSNREPHSHATLVVDEGLTLELLDRYHQPLADLCFALYLIKNKPDLYGQCWGCEGEINPKRLDVMAWAVFCVSCQDAWEKKNAR